MFRLSFIEASLRFGRKTIITNAVYQFVQKGLGEVGLGGVICLKLNARARTKLNSVELAYFSPERAPDT